MSSSCSCTGTCRPGHAAERINTPLVLPCWELLLSVCIEVHRQWRDHFKPILFKGSYAVGIVREMVPHARSVCIGDVSGPFDQGCPHSMGLTRWIDRDTTAVDDFFTVGTETML